MSASRARTLSHLRAVLRHIRRLPSTSQQSSPLRHNILSLVRKTSSLQDNEAEMRRAQTTLAAYVECITSVRELTFLRSLDTGEKMSQRERVQAMAKRVGLGTPVEYTGHDDDSTLEKLS